MVDLTIHTPSVACIRHDYSRAFHSVQLNTSLFICPYALSNHNHNSSLSASCRQFFFLSRHAFERGILCFECPPAFPLKYPAFWRITFWSCHVSIFVNVLKCLPVWNVKLHLSSRLNPCSVCRQDVLYQLRTLAVTKNARCKN